MSKTVILQEVPCFRFVCCFLVMGSCCADLARNIPDVTLAHLSVSYQEINTDTLSLPGGVKVDHLVNLLIHLTLPLAHEALLQVREGLSLIHPGILVPEDVEKQGSEEQAPREPLSCAQPCGHFSWKPHSDPVR